MIKIKLFWLWPIIIIWNHARYHASKNPVKRKPPIPYPGEEGIYPKSGE